MDSIQAIVNKLAGTSGLSVQEALSKHFGYTGLSYNEQEIFNIKRGIKPINGNSVQESLWANLKTPLSLTGPANQYSEQDLWNKAYNAGISLNQIVGGLDPQVLIDYIKGLSGLVAYYQLNETSGNAINTAPDTVGTLDGTVTGAIQGATGQAGKAYTFDGADDVVTIADNDVLDLTGNFSFFALISPVGFGESNNGRIIDKGGATVAGYSWEIKASYFSLTNLNSVRINNTDLPINASNSVSLSSWQMLGVTYDGANIKFYRNGSYLGNDRANTTNPSANTQSLYIGNNQATDRSFAGSIQHVGIVKDRAMSVSEMLNIAQKAGLA